MADSVIGRIAAVEREIINLNNNMTRVETNSDERHKDNQAANAELGKRVGAIEKVVTWLKGAAWAFGSIGTILGLILVVLQIYKTVGGR
jgi:hypothetical protein